MPTTSNHTSPEKPGIYILANNGETVCAEHLHLYGIRNGRDSRGRRALFVTPAIAQQSIREFDLHPRCEQCGARAALVIS